HYHPPSSTIPYQHRNQTMPSLRLPAIASLSFSTRPVVGLPPVRVVCVRNCFAFSVFFDTGTLFVTWTETSSHHAPYALGDTRETHIYTFTLMLNPIQATTTEGRKEGSCIIETIISTTFKKVRFGSFVISLLLCSLLVAYQVFLLPFYVIGVINMCKVMLQVADLSDDATKESKNKPSKALLNVLGAIWKVEGIFTIIRGVACLDIEDGLKLNENAQERPMIISCFQPDVALIMKKLRHKYPVVRSYIVSGIE
ncbi:hypothetical protein M8C21_025458, partial [Ambrosia artemisiifolia]